MKVKDQQVNEGRGIRSWIDDIRGHARVRVRIRSRNSNEQGQ
jgi:hypothetical protein